MNENKIDYYYFYCAKYNSTTKEWKIHDGKARFDDRTTNKDRKRLLTNLLVNQVDDIVISYGATIEDAFAKMVDYFNKMQSKYNDGLEYLVSVHYKKNIEKCLYTIIKIGDD